MSQEEQKAFSYRDRLVAFLDILGFKDAVLNRGRGVTDVIESIDSNLSSVLDAMKGEGGDWYSAKLFSDCMSISCDNFGNNLYYMLNEISNLQFSLATQGLFVRGAITYGPHFENERIIFSEALIRAYELEQKANYPRIIISDSVLDLISREPKDRRDSLTPYLITPPDQICTLDYFQHLFGIWVDYGIDIIDFLFEHKNAVIAQIEKHSSNAYVLDKYRWVAEYHNHKIPYFYNPDDYPDEVVKEHIREMMIPLTLFPSYKRFSI